MRTLPSPDGRWVLEEDRGNLTAVDRARGLTVVLTTDGVPLFGYGTRPGAASTARAAPEMADPESPIAVWSPDSRSVAVQRLDERRVGEFHLVEHLPRDDDRRTAMHSYRHPRAGDRYLPEVDLWVFDVATGNATRVELPVQQLSWLTPIELGRVWWSEDADQLYVMLSDRGERAIELYAVDASTGAARLVFREEGATYVEANLDIGRPPNVRTLPGARELIWFSERTGWGHLELRDAVTGALIRPITHGSWVVRDVMHLDATGRQVWFTAGGREVGRDRYFRHLYRASLDGGDPVLLTPEDADHEVRVETHAEGWRVVDEYSRVDGPTHCVARDPWSGEVIEHRWERPAPASRAEPFTVLARDGRTVLHGVLFRPFDFDPDRRYPVIDNVYGFPQTIATPKRSEAGPWQALADCGFIVLVLDGLGTPFRSKAFHDASYGNLEDATLPDHVTALRQLADRHPSIDLTRVGVFGASAGGTTTVRALLEYPDVFRVGVAIAGCYDHRDSIALILEKYQGPDRTTWPATNLAPLAGRLQGRLLLIWGELDDNVHPLSSMRMLSAFIDAGAQVDVLVVPGADHFVGRHPYVQSRVASYLDEHLKRRPAERGVTSGC